MSATVPWASGVKQMPGTVKIERIEVEYESLNTFMARQLDHWHKGWRMDGAYWDTHSGKVLVTWERTLP